VFAGREGTASRVARQPRTYVEVEKVAALPRWVDVDVSPGAWVREECSRRGWMEGGRAEISESDSPIWKMSYLGR
jgi:hypothetical protein